ncbi:MAG TPA: hypothetical protein VEC01_10700 [Noviherbaspirillum sp.]|uniref:hypothetical protein n=1 Tax=Noviherbaspirillum sp. TaxID=1926288 RepID=UPI002D3E5A6D|nr:hypothetical protein [Noviherbaspirillum sp.]HYD95785.1 hypothetical protein [Noviherbaspirillum sp.]
MDAIPFVRVSVEEASKSLQADIIKNGQPPAQRKNWLKERADFGHRREELGGETFKWLATLPADVRPDNLAAQYPRIANRIAQLWKRPLYCERYLDDLVMDLRGDRRGFPRLVATEIAALKVYFLRTANVAHYGVWGNRIGVD